MKRPFSTVACLLLAPSLVLAQGAAPNLVKGSKAMLFSFNGFSNLGAGNFDGGIGVKYYYQQRWALRAGLQFSSLSEDIPANPPAGVQGIDGERSGTRFGVSAAVERHAGTERVSAYLGGGLGFSTTSTESKSPAIGTASQTTVKNSQAGELGFLGGSSFNLFALAGVEFFLFKELSLAAEYRLGFLKLSRADQETTSGNQTSTIKVGDRSGFGIDNSGVLTLAVYF
ncbi:outer membrane beta-barrel protein [candidate division KSB1 bacterium]|nr:outer membrane beta-barrel protein [candidate division KSB1 bacterium]